MDESAGGREVQMSDEELLAIVEDDSSATVEAEVEADAVEVEAPDADLPGLMGKTDRVRLYDVSCSGGASTSLLVPVTAYDYHARLGYYRADGSRIALSPIWTRSGSVYAGVTLRVRFNGRIPGGTRDVRAFWWYGSAGQGPVYWNQVPVRC